MKPGNSFSDRRGPLALVFDVDGTLIDTLPAIHQALNDVLSTAGVAPVSVVDVRERVSGGFGGLLKSSLPDSADVDEARLYGAFVELYVTVASELARAYPGAEELLGSLARRGRRLAICSNSPGRALDRLLSRARLSGLFEVVVHADNAAQLKPSGAPLLQALAAMGGLRPQDAWMIGDSAMDSRCAAAAGCGFVWFGAGYGRPHADDAVLARIDRPLDLLGLVDERMRR